MSDDLHELVVRTHGSSSGRSVTRRTVWRDRRGVAAARLSHIKSYVEPFYPFYYLPRWVSLPNGHDDLPRPVCESCRRLIDPTRPWLCGTCDGEQQALPPIDQTKWIDSRPFRGASRLAFLWGVLPDRLRRSGFGWDRSLKERRLLMYFECVSDGSFLGPCPHCRTIASSILCPACGVENQFSFGDSGPPAILANARPATGDEEQASYVDSLKKKEERQEAEIGSWKTDIRHDEVKKQHDAHFNPPPPKSRREMVREQTMRNAGVSLGNGNTRISDVDEVACLIDLIEEAKRSGFGSDLAKYERRLEQLRRRTQQ